jgi:hypothetical protein
MLTHPNFKEVVNGKRGMLMGIRVCMEAKCLVSTVSLIYTTVDALAALTRPVDRPRSTRADFKNWVKRYLLPHVTAKLSEHDVYAARCGVLHTYSMHSDLSRSGSARAVIYRWRQGHRPDDPILADLSRTAIVIELENLYESLEIGTQIFHRDLVSDTNLNARVSHHISSLLCYKPWTPIFLAVAA